jgi:hypothetical protein
VVRDIGHDTRVHSKALGTVKRYVLVQIVLENSRTVIDDSAFYFAFDIYTKAGGIEIGPFREKLGTLKSLYFCIKIQL